MLERPQGEKTQHIVREAPYAGATEYKVDAVHWDDEQMREQSGAEQLERVFGARLRPRVRVLGPEFSPHRLALPQFVGGHSGNGGSGGVGVGGGRGGVGAV